MYSVFSKDKEPYEYQETIFLGVYSNFETAKEKIIIHHSNHKLLRNLKKEYYEPYEYEYYVFLSELNEPVNIKETNCVFQFNS